MAPPHPFLLTYFSVIFRFFLALGNTIVSHYPFFCRELNTYFILSNVLILSSYINRLMESALLA